ncbi:formylmethanofuran dehydrogenase, subunit A /formyltransferase/hydrolase complex subunit A [Variovorax sp. CF079]|uniref:formylmethanofuran dehydrogenase subunit A n=1 Tax=Variovorax sp. CF079 TaxID=1882774 RepID=UPI00088FC518|nr:formylmethanofuran dehydrogenase subunit A [Variovorax sp. CF079]SDE84988.1 formylmethanofuran dehydrogenase, subunit A /formyltransferase/hydrolase complex subunit A [Variovorax sp. CF079]
MTTLCLRGGRVIDPANGCDEVRDLHVREGRIVEPAPHGAATEDIDASGCIVMAGGIDMHTHIGGGKVNLARMLMPEDHRANANPLALPDNSLEMASCGTCTPGTLATGYRYVEMGYTAAFEPAMMACNARHTHMEMGDTPILDHGAYVMLGNDELFLRMLAERWDFERIRDYAGWTINASKAMGVKVVNPGGISAFKFNQRKLDVDENHVHWQITPRQVVHTLARALRELGVPHPLHIHGSNLGVAGNIQSTLDTIAALEGLPGHLTHIQFHAYGTEGPKKFSSAALQLAEAVNAHKNVSIDVGQIMFGQTVTASGDTMRQHAQSGLADPRKWIGADIECEAGCGVVPFRYREQSYVNALQWVIGLEIFLLVDDPWRVVLTTDHPNGGPFTSYPHLIRLLMDRSFREEQLAKLHPEVAAHAALRSITRELSLYEIAIMTRAGPARLLGLRDRGHLGAGAAADIAVYREDGNREAMFATPAYVFKDGVLVSRAGRVTAVPVGGTHFVAPEYDRGIEQRLRRHLAAQGSVNFDHLAIGHDELCRCCNGGSLLPAACFEGTS